MQRWLARWLAHKEQNSYVINQFVNEAISRLSPHEKCAVKVVYMGAAPAKGGGGISAGWPARAGGNGHNLRA